MSSLLFAELAATCNALGFSDGNKYYPDPHCKETIRDLIRYLRRDNEDHDIRRHLGETQVLQTDLLPILKQEWKDVDMFDLVIRLLVNLTNPALLLYREELPSDKVARNYYLQIISQLQSYKQAFSDKTVWEIIKKKMADLLTINYDERGEQKNNVIERMLILTRNVLQVPADLAMEKLTDNEPSIHDQVLWALHVSGMVDIILYLASSENEQHYYMHVLEIVSLMLREQNPSELAVAAPQRSIEEKKQDEQKLLAILNSEKASQQKKQLKYTGARHSRFGGSFVVKDMKSISDNQLIYHKPLNKLSDLSFDLEKNNARTPKNRLPMKNEMISDRRSAYSVRLFLKEFCVEFLIGAYNTLMYHVKDTLVRAKIQANDESYYMWTLKFFMEFNRNYKFQVKLVSETMSVQTFHFIQTQLENCYSNILCDKKKIVLWSRRMHLALKAYQELLRTLIEMDRSEDSQIRESSRVIKSNIFYVIEYRELLVTLMLNYSEAKLSKAYLKDLIETTHIFLKMLEQFSSKGHVMVQKPARSIKKKKKKKPAKPKNKIVKVTPEDLWGEVSSELIAALEDMIDIPDVVPFDATSDKDIEEQRSDAVKKMQVHLRKREYQSAIGLLRASREVWPENDTFGSQAATSEEEYLLFREIFFSDLNQPLDMVATTQQNIEEQEAADGNATEEESEEEDSEEDDETGMHTMSEQTFKFSEFVNRFAHCRVVESCGVLLKDYDKNSVFTNHCILKLMHRIAWDCKMASMFFQASLFRIFQNILESKSPEHKELMKFAVFIIRKFTEVARTNPKVYMELLFWKSSKDAYDIENGYGSYQEKSHSAKQVWSEEEEYELSRLYEEFKGLPEEEQLDVVDWIMKTIINQNRSRRGVMKKMKEMGLDVGKSVIRKVGISRPSKEWSEEEESHLNKLFHEFKDAHDPLGCILDRLVVKRSKARVVEKILELGLVQDKKELRKKRAKKSNNMWNEEQESGSSSSEHSESEPETHESPVRPKASAQPKAKLKTKKILHTKNVKQYSSEKVVQTLQDVIAAGMSEALDWVRSCFDEEIADRENSTDEPQPVPLLPLSEEAIVAVDEPVFLNVLTALGLSSPTEGQEVYWRIPSELSVPELRSRSAVISQAVSGSLSGTSSAPNNGVQESMPFELHEDIDKTNGGSVNSDSDTERSSIAPPLKNDVNTPWSINMRKATRKFNSEDFINSANNDDSYNYQHTVNHLSQEDSDSNGNSSDVHVRPKKLLQINSDSEDEINATVSEGNKRRMIDSDSETENVHKTKKRHVIISDDEDVM